MVGMVQVQGRQLLVLMLRRRRRCRRRCGRYCRGGPPAPVANAVELEMLLGRHGGGRGREGGAEGGEEGLVRCQGVIRCRRRGAAEKARLVSRVGS